MVPNKLLITIPRVKESPLNNIIKEFPELFDPEETDDADYNVLFLQMLMKFYLLLQILYKFLY